MNLGGVPLHSVDVRQADPNVMAEGCKQLYSFLLIHFYFYLHACDSG